MTRLLTGFFFGLMVAAAVGQVSGTDTTVGRITAPSGSWVQGNGSWDRIVIAGMKLDGQGSVIKVDAEGRVICSPEGQR